MLQNILLLVVGFALLIKGADYLVEGASSLAKRYKIPDLVIGLTIVAFGTSAPELIVNLVSSLQGNTEIAIGNIIGSNIANILLILGIAAVIYPLTVTRGTTWKEIPFSLLAALLVFFLANDNLIDHQSFSTITRIDGLVLLSFFVIYMYYVFGISKKGDNPEETEGLKILPIWLSITMVIGGLTALTIGGKWVVDSAVDIATVLGVSQSLIGLTIVAIGTSLPELATSAVAAYRKKSDIAIGNIVGSNIFNVFWILGLSAVISPLSFQAKSNPDIFMAIFASLLLFFFMFIGKKSILDRWQGIMFILIYVVYIVYLIIQG